MASSDPRSRLVVARLVTRVVMALWCAAVVGISLALLSMRFEHYAASILCLAPMALLTAGAFYTTRMHGLALEDSEHAAREGVPRGRHARVHTFVGVLSEVEAEALAGAMEGLPPHRAVASLAPLLANGTLRVIGANVASGAWSNGMEWRLTPLHVVSESARSGYRGEPGEAAAAPPGHRVFTYVLAALHPSETDPPLPPEPHEIEAWLDALVPLREEESRAEVATSRTGAKPECEAIAREIAARASRTEEAPPAVAAAPAPAEDEEDAEDDAPRPAKRRRGKRR